MVSIRLVNSSENQVCEHTGRHFVYCAEPVLVRSYFRHTLIPSNIQAPASIMQRILKQPQCFCYRYFSFFGIACMNS